MRVRNEAARLSMGAAVLAAALASGAAAAADDATAVLKRAAAAMGEPKTLRYVAEGTGYTYGQAFVPGMPWPKITVHSQIRSISYETESMREEITLSRAEPKGGGGYPLSGQQRNDQYLNGAYAWNVVGGNPQPGPRFVADRVHQLWVTPHGVIRAAQRNKATVTFESRGGKSHAVLRFTEPGRFVAAAYLNADFLVERVESRLPDPVLGEVASVATYADYRDAGGVKFPGRIQVAQGGHPTLDVAVKEVQANVAVDIALPAAVANASERVAAEKVADGVWFIAGGSHNSVAIEMKDHIVLVEAPLNDGRSAPVIAEVRKLAPGKPIRFVIHSHNHFDHSGGLRAAVAEGAAVVTQAGNKAYFQKALAARNTINPDLLARSGRKAKIVTVGDRLDMSDAGRTLHVHRIKDSVHNDTFLMVHLPKEKLLIEGDAYTPLPPNAPVPATPNANNVNLVENIERLKLEVERILPLHGRVVPLAELHRTIGRRP
ncbi:MAG: MBL fold metallo-hydrolase [Burkholderiales bacterium]|nr:MBL fold metallo-hydrolase [Burkholderiales bacterium]